MWRYVDLTVMCEIACGDFYDQSKSKIYIPEINSSLQNPKRHYRSHKSPSGILSLHSLRNQGETLGNVKINAFLMFLMIVIIGSTLR